MLFVKPGIMEKLVFVIAMGYLCYAHLKRLLEDWGGYVLDISGPLMINTQRLSCLGYALYDGSLKDDSKLSPFLKKRAIRRKPGLLEFTSYVFSFHGAMCGPFGFFDDYKAFIEGTHVTRREDDSEQKTGLAQNNKLTEKVAAALPSPTNVVVKKLVQVIVFIMLALFVQPHFLMVSVTGNALSALAWPLRVCRLMICAAVLRIKYYLAWRLAEAGNINAGFGFNGYDKSGKAKWDLIDNVDLGNVELGTSLKMLLDNWNKTTTYWLRYCIYERIHSTFAVFLFSAFWHGFYIGYYVAFLTGATYLVISRKVRRSIRPYFQTNRPLAIFYDILTGISAHISLNYAVFAFAIVEPWTIFEIYRSLYFFWHIAAVGILLVTVILPKKTLKTDVPQKED